MPLPSSSLVAREEELPFASVSANEWEEVIPSRQAQRPKSPGLGRKARRSRHLSPSPPPSSHRTKLRARRRYLESSPRFASPAAPSYLAAPTSRPLVPLSYPTAPVFPSNPYPQPQLPARRPFSILAWIAPGWGLVFLFMSAAVALTAAAVLLLPLTQSIQTIIQTITSLDPVNMISSALAPAAMAIGSIPMKAAWCGTIGIGCPPQDRHAAYRTRPFADIASRPAHEEISLGDNFFDCLKDLRITRYHEFSVAHLTTLASKVMQFEHVLESPEELSDNTMALAKARRDITLNANAARLAGGGSVGRVIDEFHNARNLIGQRVPVQDVQSEIDVGLSSVRKGLEDTAGYTLASSQHVKRAEELAELVSRQAQREISRLKRISNELEMGLKFLAKGGKLLEWAQPGILGQKQDREAAGAYLQELVEVIDKGAITLLSSTMSLQQCAANTQVFGEQIEKAFSVRHGRLTIQSQLQGLVPRIESLGSELKDMRTYDAALRSPPTLPQEPPKEATE